MKKLNERVGLMIYMTLTVLLVMVVVGLRRGSIKVDMPKRVPVKVGVVEVYFDGKYYRGPVGRSLPVKRGDSISIQNVEGNLWLCNETTKHYILIREVHSNDGSTTKVM